MQEFSALIVWSLYAVWPLIVFIIFLSVVIAFLVKPEKRLTFMMVCAAIFMIVMFLVTMLLKSHIVVYLTNQYGLVAQGQVVGQESLNRIYNEQRVHRYFVLYQTQEGEVINTFFDTDDFNVYPKKNRVNYPSVNQRFTLKYLPSLPQYIIIMRDVEADKCQVVKLKLEEVYRKLQLEPNHADLLQQFEDYKLQVQHVCH